MQSPTAALWSTRDVVDRGVLRADVKAGHLLPAVSASDPAWDCLTGTGVQARSAFCKQIYGYIPVAEDIDSLSRVRVCCARMAPPPACQD